MIAAYLKALAAALAFDPALAARVVAEASDHLADAVAEDGNEDRAEAERRAVARFGDPHMIAAQFAAVSLARRARRDGIVIVLAIVAIMAMMKARVAWYAVVQWALPEDARQTAALVLTIDRYAFWIAVVVALGALIDIGRRATPTLVHPGYRRHLRRAAVLFAGAAAALAVSVIGDLVLAALRIGTALSADAVIPIATVSIEIACLVVVIFVVARSRRRTARTVASLGV